MIYALDGPVMPYAWGSRSALPELLGREPSGGPEAELWIGAHPAGSARLVSPVRERSTLFELIQSDPREFLGGDLGARYGRLPFLLKVLAIDAPLSLQAHPDAEQARQGFAREEALGLARSDPARNYKDDNHKPELILALSPIEALSGFRPYGDVCHLLAAFGLGTSEHALAGPVAAFLAGGDAADYEALFRSFFTLSQHDLRAVLELVLGRAELEAPASESHGDVGWVARLLLRLDGEYGVDPGLLGALLLTPLRLEPGEALFLPARRLHAYLSGVGVEVMAESDNVLRGGLTQKHVDVGELCRVLDFRPTMSALTVPTRNQEGSALVFRTPAEEFELWLVEPSGTGRPVQVPSPCLFVVLEGRVEFAQGSQRASFSRGGQGFVSWAPDAAFLSGQGRVALVAVRSDVPA